MRLRLAPFMSHVETEVSFPPSGLVLVVGHNGAGKSSLLEGLVWGLWGETLRGGDPTRNGEAKVAASLALADGESYQVARTRSNGRTRLDQGATVGAPECASTVTETQRLVEQRVGPLAAFLHSCVFSRELLGSFTTASDRERKELLEWLLGLDHLADAEEAARRDLREYERCISFQDTAEKVARATLVEREEEARRALEAMPPEGGGEKELQAEAQVRAAEALLARMRDALGRRLEPEGKAAREVWEADNRAYQRAHAEASDACRRRVEQDARVARLEALAGECPTCEQAVTEDSRAKVLVRARKDQSAVREAELVAFKAMASVEEAERAAAKKLGVLSERLEAARCQGSDQAILVERLRGDARRRRALAEQAARERERAEAVVATAEARAADARAGAERAAQALGVALAARATQEAVVEALGPKGARSRLLGQRLGSLAATATAKLRAMGLPWTVRLDPTTERKGGGIAEAIALRVEGGRDYRCASAGERRRLDVAFLLALAELAQAWSPAVLRFPLFFDEVFDALDPEGIEAVAGLLSGMAKTRPVVVITHSADLKGAFDPQAIWTVQTNGQAASQVHVG